MKYVGGKQAPAQKMDPYTGMTPQELQHKIEWSKEFPIYFLHNEVGTTTTTSESLSGFSVSNTLIKGHALPPFKLLFKMRNEGK